MSTPLGGSNAADGAPIAIRHEILETAKWIAIITMTVDHYGKIVDPSIYLETNAVGRVTYPLIAWIIGVRLAIDPGLGRRYLANLVPWALLSQPVYVFVGRSWSDPNIFCTLTLGVAVHHVLHTSPPAAGYRVIAALVALLVAALFVDYGVFGVLMIPLIANLSRVRPLRGACSVGPLGVLGNLSIFPPYFGPGGFWALLSSAVALVSLRYESRIPRLPKQAFYAYYPAHLVALYAFAHL